MFSKSIPCTCDPIEQFGYHYSQFFGNIFSICLYTPSDIIGYILGIINICIVSFLQFPQLYKNYKRRSTLAIEIRYLLIANIADMLGTISMLLTGQRGTLLLQQVYVQFIDLASTTQWIYYTHILKTSRLDNGRDDYVFGANPSLIDHCTESSDYVKSNPTQIEDIITPEDIINPTMIRSPSSPSPSSRYLTIPIALLALAITQPVFVTAAQILPATAPQCDATMNLAPWQATLGSVMGYICSFLYIISPIPQLYYNYRRKSTIGYSKTSLSLAVLTFVIYQFTIYLPSRNWVASKNFTAKWFYTDVFPFSFAIFCSMLAYIAFLLQGLMYNDKVGETGSELDHFSDEDGTYIPLQHNSHDIYPIN